MISCKSPPSTLPALTLESPSRRDSVGHRSSNLCRQEVRAQQFVPNHRIPKAAGSSLFILSPTFRDNSIRPKASGLEERKSIENEFQPLGRQPDWRAGSAGGPVPACLALAVMKNSSLSRENQEVAAECLNICQRSTSVAATAAPIRTRCPCSFF